MDKQIMRETIMSLEVSAFESAREKYLAYGASARLDRSEPIEEWPAISASSFHWRTS